MTVQNDLEIFVVFVERTEIFAVDSKHFSIEWKIVFQL